MLTILFAFGIFLLLPEKYFAVASSVQDLKRTTACYGSDSYCNNFEAHCGMGKSVALKETLYGVKNTGLHGNCSFGVSNCQHTKAECCTYNTSDLMIPFNANHSLQIYRNCSGQQSCIRHAPRMAEGGVISSYVVVKYQCIADKDRADICRPSQVTASTIFLRFDSVQYYSKLPFGMSNCSCSITSSGTEPTGNCSQQIRISILDLRLMKPGGTLCSGASMTVNGKSISCHNNSDPFYKNYTHFYQGPLREGLVLLNGMVRDIPEYILLQVQAEPDTSASNLKVTCYEPGKKPPKPSVCSEKTNIQPASTSPSSQHSTAQQQSGASGTTMSSALNTKVKNNSINSPAISTLSPKVIKHTKTQTTSITPNTLVLTNSSKAISQTTFTPPSSSLSTVSSSAKISISTFSSPSTGISSTGAHRWSSEVTRTTPTTISVKSLSPAGQTKQTPAGNLSNATSNQTAKNSNPTQSISIVLSSTSYKPGVSHSNTVSTVKRTSSVTPSVFTRSWNKTAATGINSSKLNSGLSGFTTTSTSKLTASIVHFSKTSAPTFTSAFSASKLLPTKPSLVNISRRSTSRYTGTSSKMNSTIAPMVNRSTTPKTGFPSTTSTVSSILSTNPTMPSVSKLSRSTLNTVPVSTGATKQENTTLLPTSPAETSSQTLTMAQNLLSSAETGTQTQTRTSFGSNNTSEWIRTTSTIVPTRHIDTDDGGIDTAVLIGIIVGVVALILIIVVATAIICIRKRRNANKGSPRDKQLFYAYDENQYKAEVQKQGMMEIVPDDSPAGANNEAFNGSADTESLSVDTPRPDYDSAALPNDGMREDSNMVLDNDVASTLARTSDGGAVSDSGNTSDGDPSSLYAQVYKEGKTQF